MNLTPPRRPATRADFEIAVICALPIEADAVDALFDHHWDDDGPPYDKAAGDPNAYSTGAVGRHNIVLAHMPGMGKASAAAVAANCRTSFPNIKLALVVGVCGVVPFRPGGSEMAETVLGDVIVSDGVVQYDLGRRLPEQFVPKDTLLDSLGRPNTEIRALLAKLKSLHSRKTLQGKMVGYMDVLRGVPELAAVYPGAAQDKLFEATYRHTTDGMSCEECGCDGKLVLRARLQQGDGQPAVHVGLIASGDTVMKSGEDRDAIARQAGVIGFEMEGAGVWDIFPCVVIKGACDYADSHKNKAWQRYAAATAAACMKAFLGYWVPSMPASVPLPEQSTGTEFPLLLYAALAPDPQELTRVLHFTPDVNVTETGPMKRNALHIAAIFNQPQNVSLLLRAGVDKHALTDRGFTPLFVACMHGHAEVVKTLLEEGGDDPNWRHPRDATTPLHAAAVNGQTDVIRVLLDHGADPFLTQDEGWTPLNVALAQHNAEAAEILRDAMDRRREQAAADAQRPHGY